MKKFRLKIPPLIITLITAFLMWGASQIISATGFVFPFRMIAAPILVIAGGIISLSGIISFRLAKTSIHPLQFDSVSAFVESGIYSITRNPMYLGLVITLLGWAYFLSNIIPFVFIPLFIAYMDYFQIRNEEAALNAKFGKKFSKYRQKVRRWI
jgi:protein-S-isoprenylcysteine O-methyltransferase Ste14